MSYYWGAYISYREREELQAWWERRKKRAEMLGKTPVKWQPKGNLRRFNAKPRTIDSKPEQGYTDGNTSLSSESPLPTPGQGVLALKDKDGTK